MGKKKILFMIDSLGGGGAERVLLHILRDMDRSKFDISLFLVIRQGVYLSGIPTDIPCSWIFRSTDNIRFVPFVYIYRIYRRMMLELFKLFPVLLSAMSRIKEDYDIGVSFYEGHSTPLLSLKSDYFRKKVSWIHIDLRTHTPQINKDKLRFYARGFDRIYFVSGDAKKGFVELFPEYKNNTTLDVVFNPIDYKAIQEAVSKGVKPIKRRLTVLGIGRLAPQKRFDKLLNVHKRLLDSGVEHDVWILGEGSEYKMLESKIRDLGIEDSCQLLGFRDPYPYLAVSDVFAMTSDYEGLPVVVCEAMLLCKPIVSTRVTGPRELLEDGRYGMLVENTEEGIFEGMKEMLLNKELRESYSERLQDNYGNFIFPSDVKNIEERMLAL